MDIASEIIGSVRSVTKKWTKQRKAEERKASAKWRRHESLTCSYRETQNWFGEQKTVSRGLF